MTTKLTPDQIKAKIIREHFSIVDSTFTICALTLENGFIVTGTSRCTDPANFDKLMGENIARTNAIDKIWELEGYLATDRAFRHDQWLLSRGIKSPPPESGLVKAYEQPPAK